MTATNRVERFAVCAPGFEPVVAAELAALGITGKVEAGGVSWMGVDREFYAANLHLRSAGRVLTRIARFRARSFMEMERHVRKINWTPYIEPGATVDLRVSSRKSRLYHEGAIAERFARFISEEVGGVATTLRGREAEEEDGGEDAGSGSGEGDSGAGRGSATDSAGQLFVIRFSRDECTVSVDGSGDLLHRRGYRQAIAKAPLRETLAAGILLAAGWDGSTPLLDPLCGSGTFPIEGALIARHIAPGIANHDFAPRPNAFSRWPTFQPELWERLVREAQAEVRERAPHSIAGSDRDTGAITAAHANATRAGVEGDISFDVRALSAARPTDNSTPGLIVANPPYGVRIGDTRPLRNLYASFGSLVRDHFPGWTVAMIVANDGLERFLELPLEELLRTGNGGIPVRVLRSPEVA
ncbi:MAG: class I SAM-dependent RNA methyltransferase [Gemmatimonadota bacterium]|jgi:putative N6-adenine-specific DNA methylase|nr:class I SAM-dependent RNA methyltransferase [Gemmatimonadota bacterium]